MTAEAALCQRVELCEKRVFDLLRVGRILRRGSAEGLQNSMNQAAEAGAVEFVQLGRTVVAEPQAAAEGETVGTCEIVGEGTDGHGARHFEEAFEEYQDSQWSDDAMYRAGEASEKLKWCTDALAYYSVLQQRHPKSSLKKKAATRVKALKKSRKNKKKCQS